MALACGGEAAPEPSAETTAPPIATPLVQVAGCSEVDPDGTCRLASKPATLRLWVDVHGGSALEVSAGDTVLEAKTRIVDGGLALEVEVPAEAERVRLRGVDPPWVQAYELGIRRWDPPAALAGVDVADPPAAIEALRAELPKLRGEARVWAMDALRMALYRAGDPGASVRVIQEMLDLPDAFVARVSRARAAAAAIHVVAYVREDAAAAQPFMERLDAFAGDLPEPRMWAAFSQALIAKRLGDMSLARDAFAQAERAADRLGSTHWQLRAMEGLAVTLGELADEEAALSCLDRMLELLSTRELECPIRAEALNNVGWVQLLLSQAGMRQRDPSETFEAALESVGEGGECPEPISAGHLLVNLALTELTQGEPGMALAYVDALNDVEPRLAPWVAEVRALAGLRLERWELVPDPSLVPTPEGSLGLRWTALMRRGATWERMGSLEGAIAAYADAEALVDEAVDAIGVDVGRELFIAGKQASARALVETLLRAGRPDEALCRFRLARGRALRRLDRAARLSAASADARARWTAEMLEVARMRSDLERERARDLEFSAVVQQHRRAHRAALEQQARDALDASYAALGSVASATDCTKIPPPTPGEVLIAAFPREETWSMFISDTSGTRARDVLDPGPEPSPSWVTTALVPDAKRIESATRIRILATGESGEVRWHALPWNDGALIDVAPVVYGLDLASRDTPVTDAQTALVVADASEDLPMAREESTAVARALTTAGWSVEVLHGPAARRSELTQALGRTSLFHYAGHGEHAGTAGWDAAVLLSGGESFGAADVLTLPRGPRSVVLSGCETGRVSDGTLEGGMNLGHAFVLAGAKWVIVTDARVSDELSRAVGEALYDGAADPGWDGPRALRTIQRSLRARGAGDWASFRVLVP
jgi:tetratricopeptide (TPR) repeat protein